MSAGKEDERTDEALLAAVRGGDRAAMACLLARHEAPIYRFSLRMCREPEDAREVLQETLLAAARTMNDFRGDAAVSTWLYTIARSFCIKLHRRKVRAGAALSVDDPDDAVLQVVDPRGTPDDAATDHELGSALREAIAELAPMYRDVLVLRDVEGLTAPEVSAALGIGVDAVKSRLHRARAAVREKLAPLFSEPAPPSSVTESPGCPDVLTLFSRRIEGEIRTDICRALERHMVACARCAAACQSLQRTLALCKSSGGGNATVPPRVQASVRRAVRELLHLEGEG